MSEQSFKPQRKPIDPREISEKNQAQLNEMAEMRRMAAEESQAPPVGPSLEGLPITGNIPPQVQQALARRGPINRNVSSEITTSDPTAYGKLLSQIQAVKNTYEEIELPSKGRFYNNENGPTDGKLHIRTMTGHEEEILATSRFIKKGQAINMIFNQCIQENYDTERFLVEDRTYLLIYLRGVSYTPRYDVEIRCPECENKFSTVIDLNSLYVDSCPDNFDESSLKGVLPTSGIPFSYHLASGQDEQRIQDYRDKKMRNGTSVDTDDSLLYRSALLVNNLGGVTNAMEILGLLKELPINDVAHLRNTLNNPPFGVDTSIDIFCPGCLQEFTIDLPLESDFFFPRKKKEERK
jgi:hypothetical protein